MPIDYPNHHLENPHYSTPADTQLFPLEMLNCYSRLRARREAQFEIELVPLSNRPGAPLIPQFVLPIVYARRLDKPPVK